MNKSNLLVCITIILIGGFVWIVSKASPLNPNSKFCSHSIINAIIPWSSGCLYKAYFQDQPTHAQLTLEQQQLSKFAERGGVAADILWYRSVFHQRFQHHFKTPFQDIHSMHLAYTKAQHIRIDLQVDYLEFLTKNDLNPLAQSTLDNYCDTYLESIRPDILNEINGRLAAKKLPISGEHCNSRVQRS